MFLPKIRWAIAALSFACCLTQVARGAETLKLLRKLEVPGPTSFTHAPIAALSPDGKLVAAAWDNKITLFDAETGAQQLVIPLGRGTLPEIAVAEVESLGFLPDGKAIYAHMHVIGVACWDVKTGRVLSRMPMGSMHAHAALSPKGDMLAFSLWRHPGDHTDNHFEGNWTQIVLIDTKTGREIRSARFEIDHHCKVRFQPGNGGLLALKTSYEQLMLLKTADLSVVKKLNGERESLANFEFSPDGRRIAHVGGERLIVWDVEKGERLAGFTGTEAVDRSRTLDCLAHAPDGKLIAVGGRRGNKSLLILLDLNDNGKEVVVLEDDSVTGFDSVAFSLDGSKLATTSVETNEVQLWDVSELVGEPLNAAPALRGRTPAAAVKPPQAEPARPRAPVVRPRQWTSSDGKFNITAEYVQQTETHVQLRKADGALVSVAKDKLSATDRAYLERVAKSE